MLHGGLNRDERRSALDEFTSGRQPILLATDAAGEGLNLHQRCRVVINLELPWNPVRLEQRAGRVDRIGQRRTVHAFHLIARDTSETRILERLNERIVRARQVIDAADPLGVVAAGEEEILSRLAIDGDAGPAGSPIADPRGRPVQDESVRIIRLTDEAAVEHARLLRARAALAPCHGGARLQPCEDQAVAIARRSDIRSRLASRLLVIVRSTFEDLAGRLIASHITPLIVRVTPRIRRQGCAGAVTALLRDLQPLTIDALDPSYTAWRRDTSRDHHGFWDTRVARERAIAATRGAQDRSGLQPGLFDRRAERERQAGDDGRREVVDAAVRRLAAGERAAVIVAKDPGVALVLVP
ncbi:MAG: hypothetical protein A3G25_13750 [Betaproteobacteria bacterium RIFCSPLOWO2_12_FULL_63_13]|nr:MAG: hypothetical protein A3G25_13750 [Betaproteobacteria bacterium RIFCSPLOWO2_12_FULL_63_13]